MEGGGDSAGETAGETAGDTAGAGVSARTRSPIDTTAAPTSDSARIG
jgi:hypothetical protein